MTSGGGEDDGPVEHGPNVFVAVNLPHGDLAARHQAVEQDEGRVLRRERALGLHTPTEFLVEALDGVGGAQALPLLGWEREEGEQLVAALFEASYDAGAALLPLAHEGLAGNARLDQRLGVHDPVVPVLDLLERVGGRLAD